MNNKNHINQLFNRLLDNSISEEELQELMKYIRHSESDSEVKKLMDSHWKDIKENLIVTEPGKRTDKRFSEILRRLDTTRERTETKKIGEPGVRQLPLRWIG